MSKFDQHQDGINLFEACFNNNSFYKKNIEAYFNKNFVAPVEPEKHDLLLKVKKLKERDLSLSNFNNELDKIKDEYEKISDVFFTEDEVEHIENEIFEKIYNPIHRFCYDRRDFYQNISQITSREAQDRGCPVSPAVGIEKIYDEFLKISNIEANNILNFPIVNADKAFFFNILDLSKIYTDQGQYMEKDEFISSIKKVQDIANQFENKALYEALEVCRVAFKQGNLTNGEDVREISNIVSNLALGEFDKFKPTLEIRNGVAVDVARENQRNKNFCIEFER